MVNLNEIFGQVAESKVAGGGKKPRKSPRSKSPVAKRGKKPSRMGKGKDGGVDLTPFLTSLLLLGSRMAYDKRQTSRAFTGLVPSAKGRRGKPNKGYRKYRRGGSEEASQDMDQVQDIEQTGSEQFSNEQKLSQGASQEASQGGGRKKKSAQKPARKPVRKPARKSSSRGGNEEGSSQLNSAISSILQGGQQDSVLEYQEATGGKYAKKPRKASSPKKPRGK